MSHTPPVEPKWSKCCLSSVCVATGNEGTSHYVCNACKKPCDITDSQVTPPVDSKGAAIDKLTKHMVDRFLGWRLPENFYPDAGISFKPDYNQQTAHPAKHQPTGTNLFTATQATEMVKYMLDDAILAILAQEVKRVIGADEGLNRLHRSHDEDDDYSCVVCRKAYARNRLKASQRKAWAKACGVAEK